MLWMAWMSTFLSWGEMDRVPQSSQGHRPGFNPDYRAHKGASLSTLSSPHLQNGANNNCCYVHRVVEE
jgi:hypothetical protein